MGSRVTGHIGFDCGGQFRPPLAQVPTCDDMMAAILAEIAKIPPDNFLTAASYDNSTSTLTMTLVDSTTFTVDMQDIFPPAVMVNGLSYNPTTRVITVNRSDGATFQAVIPAEQLSQMVIV